MRTPYVVVAWPERGYLDQGGRRRRRGQTRVHRIRVPRHRTGRHRLGTPGTAHRPAHRPVAAAHQRRGRHRQSSRPSVLAARYSILVFVLGTVAASGWFTATGAAALAQMLT